MKQDKFITSDTHLGHANIIRYANRPFSSVEEMNEELIKRWNAKIPEGSIVYHLGDFAFARDEQINEFVNRLHGTIRLVKGNHDKAIRGRVRDRFDWVKDYYEESMPDGTKIVMCHYAMAVWNKSHHGSYMLHGHSHGSLKNDGLLRMDVGVDTHQNYEPYSIDEIASYMKQPGRIIKTVDHHTSRD